MGRAREKTMSRGALLFAFNSPKYDYYAMAEYTAKRINHFLGLPVTIVTDESSIPNNSKYKFDNTIVVEPDKNNIRDYVVWINKGRYQAYDLSPYDETLLLDTDYVVNSDRLLSTFDICDDFCCHDTTSFLMHPKAPQEILSAYSFKTLWATVITFKKTQRAKQIFECLEMVQKNYEHYANIHSFIAGVYRNDYALTLALRIANGHLNINSDIIPWNLLHVGKNTSVYAESTDEFNTEYTVMFDNWQRGKIRKEYINIKDTDFHVMNKENFLELIKNG
jgi:hypothetical protein